MFDRKPLRTYDSKYQWISCRNQKSGIYKFRLVDERKCRVISQNGKFTNVMLMHTIAITVEPPLLSSTIFFPIRAHFVLSCVKSFVLYRCSLNYYMVMNKFLLTYRWFDSVFFLIDEKITNLTYWRDFSIIEHVRKDKSGAQRKLLKKNT